VLYKPWPSTNSLLQQRQMTHYPIDDIISGLTEEQVQVIINKATACSLQNNFFVIIMFNLCIFPFQLRKTVFDFVQKELAPKANDIDKLNTFTDMRVR
jgi:hypothetical protein